MWYNQQQRSVVALINARVPREVHDVIKAFREGIYGMVTAAQTFSSIFSEK